MLSRRHIRLKVMQSLYAFFLKKEDNISKEEDAMIKHMREISDLNLSIIALMIELIKYADDFLENSKNKFFPTEEDLSPNKRFINNKISKKLLTNLALKKEVLKFSNIWIDNDHDVINKLFKDIYISDLYTTITILTATAAWTAANKWRYSTETQRVPVLASTLPISSSKCTVQVICPVPTAP